MLFSTSFVLLPFSMFSSLTHVEFPLVYGLRFGSSLSFAYCSYSHCLLKIPPFLHQKKRTGVPGFKKEKFIKLTFWYFTFLVSILLAKALMRIILTQRHSWAPTIIEFVPPNYRPLLSGENWDQHTSLVMEEQAHPENRLSRRVAQCSHGPPVHLEFRGHTTQGLTSPDIAQQNECFLWGVFAFNCDRAFGEDTNG